MPLDVATALYRIAQEALRNSRKHAPDAPVRVTLISNPESWQMTIEDAGPGFDLNHARNTGGLGLISMQERARLVGGTLYLRTRPGEGTMIAVKVPRQHDSE
jgi:signal transduction histidine kinase